MSTFKPVGTALSAAATAISLLVSGGAAAAPTAAATASANTKFVQVMPAQDIGMTWVYNWAWSQMPSATAVNAGYGYAVWEDGEHKTYSAMIYIAKGRYSDGSVRTVASLKQVTYDPLNIIRFVDEGLWVKGQYDMVGFRVMFNSAVIRRDSVAFLLPAP